MRKAIRNIICLLLCFTFLLCACANNNKENQAKYDYSIEDIAMNGFFEIDRLKEKEVTTTVVCEEENVKGYLMEGEEYSNGKTNKSFYWLGKPNVAMPKNGYPAVLLIHGGGGNAFLDWVKYWNDLGFVALALDINGSMYDEDVNLVENKEFYHDGSWGSIGCNTTENAFKLSWTYMNVCNAVFANNILRNLDYVNENYVFATGISWGGFLTCILSGVDKRFCGFAPVYGCSLVGDTWGLNVAGLGSLSEKQIEEWQSVYDPTAYLSYSTKPMLFVSGMGDHAFSPVSHKNSTQLVKGKLFYSYTKALTHGHYWKQTPCILSFFKHLMNKTQLPVYFNSSKFEDNSITVDMENEASFACLVYTSSTDNDSHNWQWENEEITLVKGVNKIDVPEGVVASFIYCEDTDLSSDDKPFTVTFSTDIFFNNN